MKLKTALFISHKIGKDLKSNIILNSSIFLSVFILFFSSSIIHGFEKELQYFYQKIPEAIYVQNAIIEKQEDFLNLNQNTNKNKEQMLLFENKLKKEPVAFAIVNFQQLILKQNNNLKSNEIILPFSFKNNQNNNIVQLTYLKSNNETNIIQDEEFVIKDYVQNDLLNKNMKFGYVSNFEKNDENDFYSLFNKELVFLYDNIEKHQDLLGGKDIVFKKSDIDADFEDIDVLKIFIYLLGFLLLIIASLNIHSTVNYFIMTKQEEFFIFSMIGYNKQDLKQIEQFLTFKLFFKPLFISILLSLISLYGLNELQLLIKNNYQTTLLNPEVYFIDIIPFEINIIEKILVTFFIILMTCFKK